MQLDAIEEVMPTNHQAHHESRSEMISVNLPKDEYADDIFEYLTSLEKLHPGILCIMTTFTKRQDMSSLRQGPS